MSEDNVRFDILSITYPHLFIAGSLPYGLQVSNGWMNLLEILFSRIDTILEEAPAAKFEVLQIKEKFGTLRFYYRLDGASDAVATALRQAVDATASASAFCCELCGVLGSLESRNGWMSVRCSLCTSV